MKRIVVITTLFAILLSAALAPAASPELAWSPRMKEADAALKAAMSTLGLDSGQPGFMVLANAGYGQADKASTEAFLDVITSATGRTPGTRSLLLVNTSCFEPLWFAVVRKDGLRAVFLKLAQNGFASQELNLSPDALFAPEAWASAAKGLIGSRLFSVASISLAWSAGAPWPMLKGAELHDHFCPGLNAGFMAKAYLDRNLPLGPGDGYVFVGAPPICAMDALQSAFGATMGKHGAYAMLVPDKADRMAKDGVSPTLIAMRVNRKNDRCDGVFLGFDWDKSQSFTGVSNADRTPPGGKKNPLFYISRAKMSWKLVQMDMNDKLACIRDIGRFSGPAALADKVASAGADPYAAALAR